MARNYLRRALGIAAFVAILALVCTTAAFANPSKGATDNPSAFACDLSVDETPITDDQGTDDSASASDDESDEATPLAATSRPTWPTARTTPRWQTTIRRALRHRGSDESADDPRPRATISPTLARPTAATSRPTWPTARMTLRWRTTIRRKQVTPMAATNGHQADSADDPASADDDPSDASDTEGSDESADVADSADDSASASDDQSASMDDCTGFDSANQSGKKGSEPVPVRRGGQRQAGRR